MAVEEKSMEEKYKHLLENPLVGIFRTAFEDGLILESNSTFKKILGYETLDGVKIVDLYIHPTDYESLKTVLQQKEFVENFETQFKQPNSNIIWVSFSAKLYPQEGCVEGIMIDITERKQAEAEQERLLATEREHRLLAEILAEVTLALTAQTSYTAILEEILYQVQRIVPCQKASIRILVEDNILRSVHQWGDEAFDTRIVSDLDQSLSNFPLDAEVIYSRQTLIIPDTQKDPRWVPLPKIDWIRSHIAAPICLGNRVLGLLRLDAGVTDQFSSKDAERLQPLINAAALALENARLLDQARQEINERKRAEEALAGERNLLRTLIDNLPDFFYVKNTKSQLILANVALAQAVGVMSPDELIGKTDFDFFPQELAEQHYINEQTVIHTGQPLLDYEEEFSIGQVDNKPSYYVTNTVPLRDNQGKIIGLVGTAHDVTRLKQAERAILESQTRLKLLNSISTSITSGMSTEQVIKRTVRQIGDYFPTLRISYSTINEQGHLTIIQSIEPAEMASVTGKTINLASSTEYLKTLCQRKPLVIERIAEYHGSTTLVEFASASGSQAFIDIPLHHSDSLTGVLRLDSATPRHWNEHEIATITEVAEYLSIALQNVHEQQERERAEAELRASEERFRLVISSISDHIYVWRVAKDDERINIYISPHAQAMTGYPLENFMNDWRFWPLTVIHPDDRAAAAIQATQLAMGQHSEVEYRLVRADGNIIWVRDSARVQTEENTLSKIVYGIVSDITERKQAELEREWLTKELRNINQTLDERVRARTAELQAIFDAAGEGIVVTNLAGVIEYLNPALEKMTGYSAEEAIGKTPSLWKSDKKKPTFYAQMWQTILAGQTWRGELINKRKDGILYDVLLVIAPIPGPMGQPIGFVGVQSDITPFKEMDRLKNDFISMAAHELRTPLTSILGFSEILLTRQLNEERKSRYLTFINQQAEALRVILEDLLDLSRLEAGQGFKMSETLVDLRGIVTEIIFGFQENHPKHHYSISNPESWPSIKGDTTKLAQLFKNLFSNATKYSPNGGEVTLTATLETEYGLLHLALTDQGIGMTPEQLAQIFDPFYRADASNTAIGGTGLGMTISRLIVERHRGKIWVESQYGVGTTVHIIFPLLNRPIYVLIIEDDHSLRELQQRVLKTEGFTVLGAEEGMNGLHLARTCLPDLILLDLALPGITGFDVLGQLQKSSLTKDIPVLITSAIDTAAEIERAIQKGAVDYLVKPYSMGDLTIRVNRALAASSSYT